MLVNKEIISELYENAGDERYQKALEYVKDKRVTITNVKYENKIISNYLQMLKVTKIHIMYMQK